jgi:DNA repair photolyase
MKTGTKEWASRNINIQRGCEHNCMYCYAREFAVRFKRCTVQDWAEPVIDQVKVDRTYGKYKGIVMFPSTHDITPRNLSECLCVLRKLLDAGNQVLIVSKPHWECVPLMCETFQQYKPQIQFRFTIGSTNDEALKFWEPGAPKLRERLACLEYAYYKGYQTSVSCEPYLDPYVGYTYEVVVPYLTDSFWIGRLRNFKRRVDLTGVTDEHKKRFVEPLQKALSDRFFRSLHKFMDKCKFVKWKDSPYEVAILRD